MIFELSSLGICVLLSIAVSWTKSPFISLMYAIILFVNASIVIFNLGYEFIALVNLLVYVGALSVLFLFVVILLELPSTELRAFSRGFSAIGMILNVFFIALIKFQSISGSAPTYTFVPATESLSSLGQSLYIHYTDVLILNSIVLTIALFGALVLASTRSK